jgi:RHH-type proline utilization regulon transcriptional repressor/proline dehydrogenase/delta 1-pyrroline-5-carboxylate dehydrogenase
MRKRLLEDLLKETPVSDDLRQAAMRRALDLVETARATGRRKGMMESFLEEFGLSNAEGLALMCLAEALLRVPDAETRDDLIADKIRSETGARIRGSRNPGWSMPRPGR